MSISTRVVVWCTLASFLLAPTLSAQIYRPDSDTTITACQGVFRDSGGELGPYEPNQNYTVTFCPEAGAGSHVRLVFSNYNILPGDSFCFYDGPDATADELLCAETLLDPSFVVQATAANPSGCLTVVFSSDASDQGDGWSAALSCSQACQNVFVDLESSNIPVMPADTGYMDICPGDRVELSGRGVYPQNNVSYGQSDLSSSFEWDFGDGTTAVGREVSHVYNESGGYIVQLTITDSVGCQNINFLNQRIRVSPPPNFAQLNQLDPEICVRDTIELSATLNGSDPGSIVSVTGTSGNFQASGSVSDSLALPDGVGDSYSTSISFSSFPPGMVLADTTDLLSICLSMEHSWMHDLQIELECPNGTRVMLQEQEQITNEVWLGEPIDNDGTPPEQGTGYEYCWTPFSTNGTWTAYSQANDTGFGQPYTLPSQDYQAFGSMADFLGCPLNGEWTIIVTDLWASDNGWIFEWGIDFEPSLYPQQETFSPEIQNLYWEDNSTIFDYFTDSSRIAAAPVFAGNLSYRLVAEDEFGCVSDTLIAQRVLPASHPDCYTCVDNIAELTDTLICEGETVAFDAGDTQAATADATFVDEPRAFFEATNHPPANPFRSGIEVNSVVPATLTDPESQIQSVCVNIETTWNSDLVLRLEAPDGQQLELSSNNGGGSDDFRNTCFTPAAVTPITAGTGPFAGEYQPEGDWADLQNSPINGEWEIIATDAFGSPADVGEFISWSITFASENEINYTWTGAGLSCTACPDPIVTPASTTTFRVDALDSYGCSFADTVVVGVVSDIPAPQVECLSDDVSSIIFDWSTVGDFTNYEVNIILNGVEEGWTGPVSGTTFTVDNLSNGDEVTLQVRVFTGGAQLDCGLAIGTASCTLNSCALSITQESLSPISCFGAEDGAITVAADGGVPPYEFALNGGMAQNNGTFGSLPAGNYLLTVLDTEGCTDTLGFDILEPDPLQLGLQVQQLISCFGNEEGIIQANVQGGSGPFEYNWSHDAALDSPTAENLGAATYSLTVVDSNGCESTDEITINQPQELTLGLQIIAPTCNDATDGSLSVSPDGGTPPYSFSWSTGAAAESISALPAGEYCVTVTDANGCVAERCEMLQAPNPLVLEGFVADPVSCNGGSDGSLTAEVSGGQGGYTYQWDDPLSQIGAQATMLAAGTYTVTVTDGNGCTLVESSPVSEPEPLSAAFSNTDVNCRGGSDGTSEVDVSGGIAPYSYNWESGATQPLAENLSAGTVGLTVTDANGCTLETSTTLQQPADSITLLVEQTEQGCFGEQGNAALATASGGAGSYLYEWSNGSTAAAVSGLDSIPYTVTVTDENGCTAVAEIIPEDLEQISFLIITNPPSCAGFEDGRLGINQISGGNGNSIEDFSISWSTGDTGPTADNLEGGVTYSVTVSDGQGCVRVRERLLPDPPPVDVTLAADSVSCFGGSDGQLFPGNIIGDNPPFSFEWSTGATSDTISGLEAGIYSLTVTDVNNCQGSASLQLPQPPQLNVDLEITDNDCFGEQNGIITATPRGGSPGYSFAWSDGSTGATAAGLTAGGYGLTLTDANGCELIAEAAVEEPEPVILTLETEDPVCNGSRNGRITVDVMGGTPPYRYSLDNDFFAVSNSLVGLPAGNYQVYVRDGSGCTSSASAVLADPPLFTVDAGEDLYEINLGDSLLLEAITQNAVGNVTYTWQAPYEGTLSCINCPRTVASPDFSILYKLFAEDERGCEASDMLRIIVNKKRIVEVPTGFTPNGDGANDRLIVHGMAPTQVLRFQVFDRWGELIYQQTDFQVNDAAAGWDGTFRGQPVAPGVYIWTVEAAFEDGREEIFRGQTTLIR